MSAGVGAALFLSSMTGGASAAALNTPAMAGPLVADPHPFSFDAGPLGSVYVAGAGSGLVFWQSKPLPGDEAWRADLSNGQIFVQNTEGWLQFVVDAGAYSQPALGSAYINAGNAVRDTFGVVPMAYVKLVPTPTFSIEAGKLPSQLGIEDAFTFQNVNIERGLLWNQTPSFTRGIQATYADGPINVGISWNDGYYSNRLNWITANASYAIDDNIHTFGLVVGANLGHTGYSNFLTPLAQNNSAICDLFYTYVYGNWMVDPYVQLSRVAKNTALGFVHPAATFSGAVLTTYSITSEIFLAARVEYIATSGQGAAGTPNLLYGPGSNAWSLTLTPTFQRAIFFARAEGSYLLAGQTTIGDAFGSSLGRSSQARLMLETGVVF